MRNGYSAWLRTVPTEGKELIARVISEIDGAYGKRRGKSWWVRLSPTTRTATEVTLFYKNADGTRREWDIMKGGQLIGP